MKADRKLKRSYAKRFIFILVGQLFIVNIAFFCVGLDWIKFDKWSLNLYMGGTLAEVFGVILVITKTFFLAKTANQALEMDWAKPCRF